MSHYHKGCSCCCRGVGGAVDRYDRDGVGGAYDRCKGGVGGTSVGGCRDVGGAYSRDCGCDYGYVGGAYRNRRKCCICFLVEPITNTLRCLFSCNRRCNY